MIYDAAHINVNCTDIQHSIAFPSFGVSRPPESRAWVATG